jgi:hypothetical protein
MSGYWYENPEILLKDYDKIIPHKNLPRIEKINRIAKIAFYLIILIIVGNKDTKWLSIPIIVLGITGFLGISEKFTTDDKILNPTFCYKPTTNNPFMNFTLGNMIQDPYRLPACKYEESKDEIRKEFRKHTKFDLSDIWGKHSSDRQFYIMPNTRIINDQTEFAKWCYGNNGKCKSEGIDCLKVRDPQYHRGRIQVV